MIDKITVSNKIKNGKNDWLKMKKKILNEENEVIGGSDIPANAAIEGGEFDTTDDKMSQVSKNIQKFGDTPEYKKQKEKLKLIVTKNLENEIVKRTRAMQFLKSNVDDLEQSIAEYISDLNNEKQNILNVLNSKLKQFIETTDNLIRHHLGSTGLAAERIELPNQITSVEDFKNLSIFYKDFLSVLDYFKPKVDSIIDSKIGQSKGSLLKIPLDEGRNVPEVGKETQSAKTVLDRIKGKLEAADVQPKLLADVYLAVGKLEVLESIIKGLNKKLQNVQASKKAHAAKNTPVEDNELIAIIDDINDYNTGTIDLNSLMKAKAAMKEEQESQNQLAKTRSNPGPGKMMGIIYEKEEKIVENVSKKALLEGWKKYSSVKRENKEQPESFSVVMG